MPERMTYHSAKKHDQFLACRDYILNALQREMAKRHDQPDTWEDAERMAVAVAANMWAEAHGLPRRVTIFDVKQVETMACGHIDYATKFALYVAELLYKPVEEIRP